jgi:hypothetical protein
LFHYPTDIGRLALRRARFSASPRSARQPSIGQSRVATTASRPLAGPNKTTAIVSKHEQTTRDNPPNKLSHRCSPPTSPSIEAAAAQQKYDNDDNEKCCHIHACHLRPHVWQVRSRYRSRPANETSSRFNCSVREPLVRHCPKQKAGAPATLSLSPSPLTPTRLSD